MQPVASSAINAVGYDRLSKMLVIEFHETGTYSYYNVPEHIYLGLMNAASKGTYFNDYIRDQYSAR